MSEPAGPPLRKVLHDGWGSITSMSSLFSISKESLTSDTSSINGDLFSVQDALSDRVNSGHVTTQGGLPRRVHSYSHLYKLAEVSSSSEASQSSFHTDALLNIVPAQRRRTKSETLHETDYDVTQISINNAQSHLVRSQSLVTPPDPAKLISDNRSSGVNMTTTEPSQLSTFTSPTPQGFDNNTKNCSKVTCQKHGRIMNWLVYNPSPIAREYTSINDITNSSDVTPTKHVDSLGSLKGRSSIRRPGAFREFNALTPSNW